MGMGHRERGQEEFLELWAEAKKQKKHYIAVSRELDIPSGVTPVSVYECILRSSIGNQTAIMESAGQDKTAVRYSYLALNPFLRFIVQDEKAEVKMFEPVIYLANEIKDALAKLQALLAYYSPLRSSYQPPFVGGGVGIWGFNTVKFVEPSVEEGKRVDDGLPDVCLDFYDRLIVFDHEANTIHLVASALVWGEEPPRQFGYAMQELNRLARYIVAGESALPATLKLDSP